MGEVMEKVNYKSGVTKWMKKQGLDVEHHIHILREFVPNSTHNDTKESLCLYASQNWSTFTKWFFENTKEVEDDNSNSK